MTTIAPKANRGPGGRAWCGPIALTVVTGDLYETLEAEILAVRGSSPTFSLVFARAGKTYHPTNIVKSSTPRELKQVLENRGYTVEMTLMNVTVHNALFADYTFPRIQGFVERVAMQDQDAFFIVWSPSHFYTVKGSTVWDVAHNHNDDGIHYKQTAGGKQRVNGWLRITKPVTTGGKV